MNRIDGLADYYESAFERMRMLITWVRTISWSADGSWNGGKAGKEDCELVEDIADGTAGYSSSVDMLLFFRIKWRRLVDAHVDKEDSKIRLNCHELVHVDSNLT